MTNTKRGATPRKSTPNKKVTGGYETTTATVATSTSTLPKLYLAGKIWKGDWRHSLIPALRAHQWITGPLRTKSFAYVGPFFESCNHGCSHGDNTHGVLGFGCSVVMQTQHEVFDRNTAAVASADLIFAHITATDCYGTLFEIGMAHALGKRVVLAFAPGMPIADFWFAACTATVYTNVQPCCLAELLDSEIERTTLNLGGAHRG
jgi:nucleoside 2-deoxyribosyltransferase